MKRTAFFISDGTGITAEALGNSLLAQFEAITFEKVTLPYIDNMEKAQAAVKKINAACVNDDERPIIFDTIVNKDIRSIISHCDGFKIDVFSAFLSPLENELKTRSSYSVGGSHAIGEGNRYKARIESVNYAIDNDDGGRIQQYDKADIILLGVSRSGKTPTCLYMAMQFGIRAANYPLTEEDLLHHKLPELLEKYRHKLYGLTIEPFQLSAIRQERRPNSRYASLDQCDMEVRTVEKIFRQDHIRMINTTTFSIEEIATRIMADAGLQRRIT
ncbi:MAG: posphoenolpyruvate synthetase regulatory kinase/phosphorylase PpsR [Pontibacterium sp.]